MVFSTYPFGDTDQDNPKIIDDYMKEPPRSLNGGLYTGEPFVKNAPYGNFPLIPNTDYMTNINLRSANPPVEALYQYVGNTRPGNNFQENPGLINTQGANGFNKNHNFKCIPSKLIKPLTKCNCINKNLGNISGNEIEYCECSKNIKYINVD